MNAQDIIAEICEKVGVDQAAGEKVVGTIFSVLQHEAQGSRVGELLAKIPGASDLAGQYDVTAPAATGEGAAGGLLSTLSSALGNVLGGQAGALINGISQLRASGLDAEQIREAGTTVIQKAEAAAGPDLVKEVVDSVPGLKGHLGLS
ncbi:hypothetical protein SAZ10_03070 [Mesorhizobium sp. BAC0120]|uniref:hypothetical protein n=1 Tax=Mesorhizobium sp. BAC0120 TaxID=3090670 RepID=UPI00298C4A9C|nr:hypothetical protein [Mesorhizobium sp. BAC0120]MDW6020737.1 hypothetical protein [Mesorhizobium sp. BAC0120]